MEKQNIHQLKRLKGVLVDVDNTLLDFEKSSQLAIKRTCEDFGILYSDKLLDVFLDINHSMWRQIQDGSLTKAQLWQHRWNKIFGLVGISADGPTFEKEFHRYLHECAVPVDGAIEFLEYLHSKYTVCTASNASFEQQHHRLDLSGMLKYIDKMFVSEQIGAQKPNSAFFEACFKKLPFSPQKSIMIGDDLHADMLGASQFKMLTCWYNPLNLPNLENVPVDFVISDLSDIKQYI